MSYSVKIDLSGNVVTGKAGALLQKSLNRTLVKWLLTIDNRVSEKIPVGVGGDARRGVSHKLDSFLSGRIYETGPATSYIVPLEKGRRKNKRMPPANAIEHWLKFTDKGKAFVRVIKEKYNLKTDVAALKSATFLKRRAIAQKGTRPVRMFQRTYKETKPLVVNDFRQTVARFARS